MSSVAVSQHFLQTTLAVPGDPVLDGAGVLANQFSHRFRRQPSPQLPQGLQPSAILRISLSQVSSLQCGFIFLPLHLQTLGHGPPLLTRVCSY
jgi:hypothetical protein